MYIFGYIALELTKTGISAMIYEENRLLLKAEGGISHLYD